jgi:hypothetical protein
MIATLGKRGMKGTLAGTATNNFLLYAATNEGKLKDIGVDIRDAKGELKDLGQIFDDLNAYAESGSTLDVVQKFREIFNIRGMRGAIPFANLSEEFKNMRSEIKQSVGYAQEMTNKITQSISNKLLIVKSAFDNVIASLIDSFLPSLKSILDYTSRVLLGISNWVKQNSALVSGITKILGVFAAITIAVTELIAGITFVETALLGSGILIYLVDVIGGVEKIGAVLQSVLGADVFKIIKNSFKSVFGEDVFAEIESNIFEISGIVNDVMTYAYDVVVIGISKIIDYLLEAFNKYSPTLINLAGDVAALAMEAVLDMIAMGIVGIISFCTKQMFINALSIGHMIVSVVVAVIETIIGMLKGLFTWSWSAVENGLTSGMNRIRNSALGFAELTAENAASEIKSVVSYSGEIVQGKTKELEMNARNSIDNVTSHLGKSIERQKKYFEARNKAAIIPKSSVAANNSYASTGGGDSFGNAAAQTASLGQQGISASAMVSANSEDDDDLEYDTSVDNSGKPDRPYVTPKTKQEIAADKKAEREAAKEKEKQEKKEKEEMDNAETIHKLTDIATLLKDMVNLDSFSGKKAQEEIQSVKDAMDLQLIEQEDGLKKIIDILSKLKYINLSKEDKRLLELGLKGIGKDNKQSQMLINVMTAIRDNTNPRKEEVIPQARRKDMFGKEMTPEREAEADRRSLEAAAKQKAKDDAEEARIKAVNKEYHDVNQKASANMYKDLKNDSGYQALPANLQAKERKELMPKYVKEEKERREKAKYDANEERILEDVRRTGERDAAIQKAQLEAQLKAKELENQRREEEKKKAAEQEAIKKAETEKANYDYEVNQKPNLDSAEMQFQSQQRDINRKAAAEMARQNGQILIKLSSEISRIKVGGDEYNAKLLGDLRKEFDEFSKNLYKEGIGGMDPKKIEAEWAGIEKRVIKSYTINDPYSMDYQGGKSKETTKEDAENTKKIKDASEESNRLLRATNERLALLLEAFSNDNSVVAV